MLDAVGGTGVHKLYYLQALRASGCDQRAHHVRKCYYLHTVMGGWSPPCAQILLFACMQGGVKIWLPAVGERVYANSIMCKHLGQLGVTREHNICANAIICTQLGGGSTSCTQMLLLVRI